MIKTIAKFGDFNSRRYSDPWVAIVNADAKIDFKKKVGGYTGGYHTGDAGDLYVTNPEEGCVYAYGQKDYRGKNSSTTYVQYTGGEFHGIDKTDLVSVLNKEAQR